MQVDPQRILNQSQSNFAIAFWGLGVDAKRAMTAVYAFCRVVDDLIDESLDLTVGLAELEKWRIFVDDFSSAGNILERELVWSRDRFNLSPKYFHEIITGVAQDAEPVDIQTWEALWVYCDRVASSVGHLCLEILGVHASPHAPAYAIATGRALQLTNIIRDVSVDGAIGRIYVPSVLRRAHGVSASAFFEAKASEPLIDVLTELLDHTRTYYNQSEELAKALDPKKIWVCEVMKRVYFDVFKQISKDPKKTFGSKVRVSKLKKIWMSRSEYLKSRWS